MHENLVSGLVRRRRELALEADTVRARHEELLTDVAALDRSILIFRPEADLKAIQGLAAAIGIVDSEPNIRNKLSRGKFTAVFYCNV